MRLLPIGFDWHDMNDNCGGVGGIIKVPFSTNYTLKVLALEQFCVVIFLCIFNLGSFIVSMKTNPFYGVSSTDCLHTWQQRRHTTFTRIHATVSYQFLSKKVNIPYAAYVAPYVPILEINRASCFNGLS